MKNHTEEEKEMINAVLEGYTNRPFWMGLSEFKEVNGLTPKPKLELGFVYKDKVRPEWLMMYATDGNIYGFADDWGWLFYKESVKQSLKFLNEEEHDNFKSEGNEWITALTKETEKRGYVLGGEIVSFTGGTSKHDQRWPTYFENGEFCWNGSIVMKDGIWAKIVKVPEAKKVRMSEVEKKFGCKVEIIND
jgi:hypothetical protein